MSPTTIDPGTGTIDDRSRAPGVPGYRTASERSGYDPIDTQREAAQMEGTLYRNLFTGRLRTRSPILIGVMVVAGVACLLPMVLSIVEALDQGGFTPTVYCTGPFALIAGFFFFNAYRSLRWRQLNPEAWQPRPSTV